MKKLNFIIIFNLLTLTFFYAACVSSNEVGIKTDGEPVEPIEYKTVINKEHHEAELDANTEQITEESEPEAEQSLLDQEYAGAGDDDLTQEEIDIIDEYIEDMVFMVHYEEPEDIDEEMKFFLDQAVAVANKYLIDQSIHVVLQEQVERLRRDQQLLYEEATGMGISVIQFIAQKLNADVYVLIDAKIIGETERGRRYYAQAGVVLSAYEASTGELLGSNAYNQLNNSQSSISMRAARTDAIKVCITNIIDDLVKQAKNEMKYALRKGIKYELIIQNTQDARTMAKFVDKLEKKNEIKNVDTFFKSVEETKYYVWLVGKADELELLIYDVVQTIPGLEDMTLVSLRGKSLTFNSGM